MEILRRRRAVGDSNIAVAGQLQKTLEAGAGVFGARAFVAVRQKKREARRLAPLREARRDELIDDDLRAVREIAELSFPQDQSVGRRCAIAVLEAEARVLGKRAIVDLE